jgi:hypothetical protein
MIYEILVRPSYDKRMTSDHLIWIESNLPTRSFERWLSENSLLEKTTRSPIVRWSIVQTKRAAHFVLATQQDGLKARISELMSGASHLPGASEAAIAIEALPASRRGMELSAA